MGKGNGKGGGRGAGRGSGQHGGRGGGGHGWGQQQENNTGMFCAICNTNTHNTNSCFKLQNNHNNNQQNHKQQKPIICYQCNKKGHHGDNCKRNPNKNNNQTPNNSNITRPCSTCEGWHLDKHCNARTRFDNQGMPIVCKWCHRPHYNAQCPKKLEPNWRGTNALAISADGNSTTLAGINGEPITMSGYILRPCLFCNGNHLPSNCPHREVLEPRYEAQAPPATAHASWQGGLEGQRYYAYPATANTTLTGSDFHSPTRNFYIPHPSKWHDDQPTLLAPSQYRNENFQLHPNTLISSSSQITQYSHTHPHLGRGNREFHRVVKIDQDNDILMSDIDDCDDCEFTDAQCEEHVGDVVRRLSEEGWAIRRRASELRRGGILDENYVPLFGGRPCWA